MGISHPEFPPRPGTLTRVGGGGIEIRAIRIADPRWIKIPVRPEITFVNLPSEYFTARCVPYKRSGGIWSVYPKSNSLSFCLPPRVLNSILHSTGWTSTREGRRLRG